MAKNIIICYDGTSNEYSKNNTNIVKTFESIIKDKTQYAFYDPGVGTFNPLNIDLGLNVGNVLGKAFGVGLVKNIEDGYEYLMNNFEKNDKVFIFGFSRGAFTARSLAGMIHHFGVLEKGSKNLIPYVSKMSNQRKLDLAKNFKKTFCKECKPHFIGIYDSVSSLGYFNGKKFFDETLNPDVQNAYHAISIDEQRAKFKVSLWDESKKQKHQNIEQVWFSGVHSDIGGSYKECGLSDIAFIWMMDSAIKCGLKAKEDYKKDINQNYKDKIHNSRKSFWKLWSKTQREIPKNALIHNSVLDRKNAIKSYNPNNVKDYHFDNLVFSESYLKKD